MDPVWTLFSRRTFSRLAYWLSALGYNLRDRSVSNRLYLVYFCVFWAVWAIAVFALLGSGVATLFNQLQGYASPPQAIVTLAGYALITWALVLFWQVSRRSPFVFNEEDAYLLCQTPVNRRKVALVWFLQGILGTCLPLIAGTIVLSFALVDWRLQGEATTFQIIAYLRASLTALILVMPVQIGWQAALWGLGALRLHQRNELAWLRPAFLGAVLFFLAGLPFSGVRSISLAPVSLSLQAAFMDGSIPERWGGLSLAFLYMAAGLAFLSLEAGKLNLGRAAQETRHVAAVGQARSYGQFDLANALLLRRRLGTTRPPSRLLARSDENTLFWKDLLQSLRTVRLRDLVNLVWIFGLSLGMLGPSNWALQMVLAGVWTISIGSLITRRLRSDLARWWLLRSLPLSSGDLLKEEIVLSWGICALVGWAAIVFNRLTVINSLYAAVLLPILAANAALAAASDILRQSNSRILMSPSLAEENVPQQNIWGVLRGLISVLLPFGILAWSFALPGQAVLGAAAFPIAAFMTWLNRKAVLAAYRWIE